MHWRNQEQGITLPGGEATCSEGFVVSFLKVPHASWSSMAAAVQPNGPGRLSENILQNLSEQVAASPGMMIPKPKNVIFIQILHMTSKFYY